MTKAFRFWYGFASCFVVILVLNALSVYDARFGRDCADCFAWGGVPFVFMMHGGFVGRLEIYSSAVRADIIVALVLSAVFGLISIRLLRQPN